MPESPRPPVTTMRSESRKSLDPGPPPRSSWRRLLRGLGDWLLLFCSTRVVVEGESMWPALRAGDRLLVNRLAYRFSPPHHGDIVLLHDPERPGFECIKRIVALPDGALRIPPEHYFVLGDNRAFSRDSRSFGPVHRSAIIGRAWRRYARQQAVGNGE
jgi:nickel-type superoxide dismutase maturation protease